MKNSTLTYYRVSHSWNLKTWFKADIPDLRFPTYEDAKAYLEEDRKKDSPTFRCGQLIVDTDGSTKPIAYRITKVVEETVYEFSTTVAK